MVVDKVQAMKQLLSDLSCIEFPCDPVLDPDPPCEECQEIYEKMYALVCTHDLDDFYEDPYDY